MVNNHQFRLRGESAYVKEICFKKTYTLIDTKYADKAETAGRKTRQCPEGIMAQMQQMRP